MRVYLDNAATTPLSPEVIDLMTSMFTLVVMVISLVYVFQHLKSEMTGYLLQEHLEVDYRM